MFLTITYGKKHMDPYEAENQLVQVGTLEEDGTETTVTFYHEQVRPTPNGKEIVQRILDRTTLLIAHNAVHDLTWLWECGFKYDGPVYDTMLSEYVLNKGQGGYLNLKHLSDKYDLSEQKLDTMDQYFKNNVPTSRIPHDELDEYLRYDLRATKGLRDKLEERYLNKENTSLAPIRDLTMRTCVLLAKMNQRGIRVDSVALKAVRDEFIAERNALHNDLMIDIKKYMGDTNINLNSPEQMSMVIFSRKAVDKKEWARLVTSQTPLAAFKGYMRTHMAPVYKTTAKQCGECNGEGYVQLYKKDGAPRKNKNVCHTCKKEGVIYVPSKEMAGLKFTPPTAKWASANGFSTSKEVLTSLSTAARAKGLTDKEQFLEKLKRLSAIESYLSSFIGGIAAFTKADGLLHVQLTQAVTATGRFSGRNPNMQNMPRGGTFPVKKVFVSRWEGGKIMEADFGQLEFRVAAYLSQDNVAIEEIRTGFDVHSYTAQIISEAGQKTSRQEAKAHTFAPLYGATGYGRTPAEAAYYEHFMDKYQGIADWHKDLATEALTNRKITTPSGRQFAFPDVARRKNGTVTQFTMIKNYPVQSFATADIVPLVLLHIEDLLEERSLKSVSVNSVHDSTVIDIYPGEEDDIVKLVADAEADLIGLVNKEWDLDFNVPLALGASMGYNWLDQKDCA